MIILQSSLYAAAFSVCLLGSLFVRSGPSPLRLRYFLAFLALEACCFALEWLMAHPGSPGKGLWLGLLMNLSFFLGPCLWLFARQLENQTPRLPLAHLAIVCGGLLLSIPLLQTTHGGADFADPAHPSSAARNLFIHTSMLACIGLFLWQVPWYLRQCLPLLHEGKRSNNLVTTLLNPQAEPRRNALRLLLIVLLGHWLLALLRTLHCLIFGKDFGIGPLFAILQVAITLAALIALLRQHRVENPAASAAKAYARSGLDEVVRQRILRKLDHCLKQEKIYTDSNLNFAGLCQHLREAPHYISQVINQDLNCNFYELINQQRIEAACQALGDQPQLSILDIAHAVGFNAKSTFNAAFTRQTGTTPSAYRKGRSVHKGTNRTARTT